MSRLVLGVVGHVDHGKTALVRALTGQDTDRLEEEKARGISIALGFAHLTLDSGEAVDLIDMPGHERFVRTMISGATGLDAVLLVVAANEGIKPQTVEHVDIAGLLGLKQAVVAVTKADLVSPEAAVAVGDEAVRLLARAGLEAAVPILTVAPKGEGMEALSAALADLAGRQPPRPADGLAVLPIDRAFSVAGHGPVVTGTLRGAEIAVGDTLELWPERRPVRVRTVQVHGARVDAAEPGQRTALNLRDVEVAALKRGMVLAAPDALAASDWLTVALTSVDAAPPLKNGMRLLALVGTEEVEARLRLLDRDAMEPGEKGFAQLHLARPLALPAREHLVLRLISPPRTVAGGRVLEPVTRRLRRRSPEALARLANLRDLSPPDLIAAEVEREAAMGTTLRRLSQLTAFSPVRVGEVLQGLAVVVTRGGVVVRRGDMEALLERIPEGLSAYDGGLSPARLLALLPGTGPLVLEAAIGRLLARGVVIRRGVQVLLPRPEQDQARARDEAALAAGIAEILRRAGLTPPDPKQIVTGLPAKHAVDQLLRAGVVVRAVDRAKGKEILFHQDAVAEAQARLKPLFDAGEGLLVTEICSALGISRKYAMPLLDHLDTIRFTQRVEDRRVLAARGA